MKSKLLNANAYLVLVTVSLLLALVWHPNQDVQLSLSISAPLVLIGVLVLRFLERKRIESVETDISRLQKDIQSLIKDREMRRL